MINKYITKYTNLSAPIKASIWFTICSFLQKGISVITTPIFSRMLSTEQYGDVSVFYSWHDIFIVIISLNFASCVYNNARIKYKDDIENVMTSLIGINLTISIFLILVYSLFYNGFSSFFSMNYQIFFMMVIQIFFFSAFDIYSADKRYNYLYKEVVFLSLIISVLSPLLSFFVIRMVSWKAEARILSSLLIQSIFYGIVFIRMIKKSNRFFNIVYWKYSLRISLPLIPHFLSQIILNSSDRIMIKNIIGSNEAAFYSMAYSAAMFVNLFISSINKTMLPNMYQKMEKKDYKSIKENTYKVSLLIIPIIMFFVILAPEILRLLAPSSYRVAVYLIPSIASGTYFIYLYSIFVNVEMYFEWSRYTMISSVICAFINIVSNYIFINIFGYCVAGYTTLFSYVLLSILHYSRLRMFKDYKMIFSYKKLYLLGFGLVIFNLFILLVYDKLLLRLTVLVCVVIYLIIAYAFLKKQKSFKMWRK